MPRYTTGPRPTPLTLPTEGPVVAHARAAVAQGVAVAEPQHAEPQVVEAVVDPVGRCVDVDGRQLSERLMFSMGYSGLTYAEMAGEFAASVLWLEVVLRGHSWLEDARQQGVAAGRRDRGILSERALGRLVDGYVQDQQKVTKDGIVVPYKETVGPSAPAVVKALESLEPRQYGKAAQPVQVTVTVEALAAAKARVAAAASDAVFMEVKDG